MDIEENTDYTKIISTIKWPRIVVIFPPASHTPKVK